MRRSRLATIVAACGALVVIVPIVWIVTTALTPENAAVGNLIPPRVTLGNITGILTSGGSYPVGRWLLNSIAVSTIASLLVIVLDALIAFALARLRFPGRNILLVAILSSLAIPPLITFVPLYLEFSRVGLLNTYEALILPYTANAFGVLLLYQFYRGVPDELEDAARVDGAHVIAIWRRIFLPLARPMLATVGILTFIGVYNDFFWPLVATSSTDLRTVTVGIEIASVGQYATNYQQMMAMTLISVIPMLAAFVFAQRALREGIVASAAKG
jgi:multiple sugar transport system permease protein